MKGGTEMYLCKADIEQLKMEIYSAENDGLPLDTSSIITKAFELKKVRYSLAADFIHFVNAPALLSKIQEKEDNERPPARSWINGVLAELQAAIRTTRLIDILRIICATLAIKIKNKIKNRFFTQTTCQVILQTVFR